ncbi:hypothetical protein A2442_00395 [Candidatus Campbellbacteria bacterium RIFOXYC2_FULL_35_25]|uniref:Glycosidase n=1 Tax=Candidatus Campbellbacteria bacterium RIFOXYC2_FULL_35_25 TaxID=1797582 RepID=A0A1F5EIB2_9BACT|nr:MAG: hypothetical protein A2442_00395 [Candidatus Campbellbacteria bacterium RIFOXYC2_FULL_35_25]
MFVLRRSKYNPILSPVRQHNWESFATFNWSPIQIEDKLHCVYRAMSLPEPLENGEKISMSVIGHASSDDGIEFDNRLPFIVPEESWEKYGCEDPRVTKLDGKYYIFYTALSEFPFRAEGIKVAVAISKDLETIEERHLVTPFNAKAMAMFPEKINGKTVVIFGVNTDNPPAKIAIAEFDKEEDLWNEKIWNKWYENIDEHTIDPRRSERDHVEVGAPPIKTEHGWLLVYSYIKDYFNEKNRVFGIEALLLDLNDPKKIIGRTSGPIMVPETTYEKYGHLSDIIFPSGAMVRGENLEIYYGSTDTLSCRAKVNLKNLMESMIPEMVSEKIKRFEGNPILEPIKEHLWENKYVFNPTSIYLDGKFNILYRAMGDEEISVIGLAKSNDGFHIDERLPEPIYKPRELFESKGCEDARIVEIGERLHMTYTAFDGINVPKIAVTSIATKDFIEKKWDWEIPTLISQTKYMDKDACILPQKTSKGYMVFHRMGDSICCDFVKSLHFDKLKKCIQLLLPRFGMWDSKKVGISAPPFLCDAGWILIYHGVGDDNAYKVGVALFDKDDPSNLIATTSAPILEPELDYEKNGQIPNVVFPCGTVLKDNVVYIYYGGADSVVAVATIKLDDLIKMFD